MKTVFIAAGLVVAMMAPARLARGAPYTITDVGAITSAGQSLAINDHGAVVGSLSTNGGTDIFLYDGTVHDLGPGTGNAINNSGVITGQDGNGHVYTYGGTFHDLGPGIGWGINDSGAVTGTEYVGTNSVGFLYDGTLHTLPSLVGGGDPYAPFGINNSGQIVGEAAVPIYPGSQERYPNAFFYDGTAAYDIGTPGADHESVALAINASGQILGVNSGFASFLYIGGVMHSVPIFGLGLNDAGVIAGDGPNGAALYSLGGPIVDLNALIDPLSGWTLNQATDINNVGQIVGTGTLGGVAHIFILTPVPEPSTFVLAALGTALLGYYAFRRT